MFVCLLYLQFFETLTYRLLCYCKINKWKYLKIEEDVGASFFVWWGGEMTSLITQTGPLYMESSYHVNLSLYPLIRRIIWFYPASSFYSVCINDRRILKRLFQDLSTKMALTPLLLPKSPNMDIFFYWFSFFCFVLFLLIIPPDARINQVQESWLGAPKIVRELHTGVKPVHRYSKMIIIKGGKKEH